ncbi:helix-turn-helix domain-containing protein [Litorisediminicola beolgyonensis]|uniref:Helix-turn-helix domain-containing protein n=1 Tax=Litorisediminicola beolgyonensis TaxID=1173614 RepID=A0ABW3ZFE0_9RHOB
MTRPPHTPDSLADRWACSSETVRQLCRSGQLKHFRVGRMIRISAEAVDEFEARSAADADAHPEGRS